MNAFKRLLIVGLAIVAVGQTAATAAPDRTMTVMAGETVQWTGDASTGTNLLYWGAAGTGIGSGRCSKDLESFCDVTLIEYANPVPQEWPSSSWSRASTIRIDWPVAVSDYDVKVFRSNANGDRLDQIGASARTTIVGGTESFERVDISVRTTRTQPSAYFLVEVVYFAGVGGYQGSITF